MKTTSKLILLFAIILSCVNCANTNTNSSVSTLNNPDNASTIRPTSGIWDFNIQASAANLSGPDCPQGSAGISSNGEARLEVSPDGLNAALNIDEQAVSFVRPNYNDTLYDSYEMGFISKNGEDQAIPGTVRFTFNVIDQEKIENGKIFWDNKNGCTGTYPFTMELVQATEIQPYVPSQGIWAINHSMPIYCGINAAELTPYLTNLPNGSGNMTVTGGGPMSLLLNLASTPVPFSAIQNGYSNFYNATTGNIYLGSAVNALTSTNTTYYGQYINIIANSETSISAMILITGSDGCSVLVPFSINHT
jgi:hypothetical protein